MNINDSLAICEFLAESHPEKSLWPKDSRLRAMARSATVEMHSGFQELRHTYHTSLFGAFIFRLGYLLICRVAREGKAMG